MLNRGDTTGALVDLNIALKDFGGLTSKTDLDDVRVRADLVLAYLLAKKRDKAQEFIGMTGEGTLQFHAEFSQLALERGWLRLFVLRLDGEPAAATYSFCYRGHFYYYQAGLDAVICGVGAQPDVMLARKSGLALGDLGGVLCDSCLRTSAAIGKCRCGLTFAIGRNRRGLCSTIGSRSSKVCIPVAFGLYSQNRIAASTP